MQEVCFYIYIYVCMFVLDIYNIFVFCIFYNTNENIFSYFIDYYSSRRQLYDDDPIVQKTKQPM